MKDILHRLPMRSKFVLVLVLPLIALGWFAASGVIERQSVVNELSRMQTLTTLAQRAGNWVHQSQLERGMTAGFLGSQGEAFGDRLSQQRPNMDAAVEAFFQQRDQIDAALLGSTISTQLVAIEQQWQRNQALRDQVDQLRVATPEALAHYTNLNSLLMVLVGELAHLTGEGAITRQLAAYYNLLEAKDLAGIERALLSNVFAADAMPEATLQRLLSLIGEERAFLETFRVLSGAANREALETALSGPEVERVLERRALAIQQTAGFGVNPEEWFDWQTVKIGRLKALEDSVSATIVSATDELKRQAQQDLRWYLAIAVVATVIAIGMAILIVRTMTRPLQRALVSIAERGDDLTQRLPVPGSDELSRLYQAVNDASAQTEQLIAEMKRNAQSVALASNEIAQGNQDLAQRTEEQSASLVQTASSMEQMTATVRQNADNAHQAQRMTGDVANQAQEATEVAMQARQAMQHIHQANEQVTTIVTAIDNIAFQTNLLALNASVEAARAGEHGRGFAVVADEVRKLASRSAEEANQIRRLIDNNVARINEGETLVSTTSDTLEQIAARVQKMASLMDEISTASHEQSSGVEQISRAMAQLEDVTQQNAALVEQVATASRSLDEQAEEMTTLVSRFHVEERSLQSHQQLTYS
ncbi:methyl-accepting chemotaxis sensory transducer [Vreelandella aquamarina]|uniref:Methyl-accepting chemotaxis protein n=2 Tax=Vreelandella aquamarina TaxID=77097 RepID=A0A1N6E7X0_9GAMM|nr:methyl-accepting chemotaxis sensory transducer [Halomonas meridiana]SIN66383.1 Methyl-accepting chemotaxis protein [Halomonas meridiana]SIN79128.1 Methyl-accepting chemotaxis protein [Halomonas meridiana]SIO34444.1 Methyl-accepting chemotaxis protein [Halomonas meridiana]